uniref:Citron Rho-interacting kinase n=2 Tax=Plectus sambesii TaxID=2011161 RepID=A0A914ULP7_9BILA
MATATRDKTDKMKEQLVLKDAELKSLMNENERLEQTLVNQTDIIKELQEQLEQGSNADQSILLATTNKISSQEKRVYQRTIDDLNEHLEEAKNQCHALKNTLDVENRRSTLQQQEIAKRKEQLQQSTELIAKLKTENEQLKQKCADLSWERREEELRFQMNERVIEDEANIVALETKLAQRQREVCKLEEELHTTRETMEAEIRRVKLELQDLMEKEKQRTSECTFTQKQLIEANAEVHALRNRLNVSTPLRIKRTESMEDMLIGQVKALTQQIEQIKAGQGDGEEAKALRERLGTLSTTKEFLEKQLQQAVTKEQQLTSDLNAAQEEIETLKMKTEQLEKKLGARDSDSEKTHNYLLDENSKIKQQKAELRCRFLELQRELSTVKAAAEKTEVKANEEMVAKQLQELKATKTAANEAAIERDEMTTHAENLEHRLNKAEAEITLLNRKLERADQTVREQAETDAAKFDQLKKECLALSNEKAQLQLVAQDLDKQCEQLQELREVAERRMREKAAVCADLETRLTNCQQEIAKLTDASDSIQMLTKERDRLQEKVAYLSEELRETHTDYREELANLARQMSESKRKDATENETYSIKVGCHVECIDLIVRLLPVTRTSSLATTPRRPMNQSNSQPPSSVGGTMRHDIPHRWKPFIVLTQVKCAVCLDGLPRVRHAFKCIECKLVVHRHCSGNIMNTCGLPMMCADFYLDETRRIRSQMSQQGVDQPDSRMTGWVRLWRSDEPNLRWRDAWARIDGHSLAFFDNDNLAVNNGTAFYVIKLAQQGWRVHFQSRPDDDRALRTEDMPYLIEIKIHPESPEQTFQPYRLYLMAPTMPAKQRWVQALQIATNRRMFERRSSSLNLRNNCLLRLESPHNLTIHSSIVLDDTLLLGCQEGLFFTSASSVHVPYNVAGLGPVFQLELIAGVDMGMLVVITGSSRCVSFIHLTDLRTAFKSSHPAVKATALESMSSCHLLMVAYSGGNARYLCVADPDQVHIWQYNVRLDIFAPHKRVATSEPATCLTQMGERLLLGADTFYAIDLQTGSTEEFLQRLDPTLNYASARDAAREDYPVGAVLLSETEVLLAYQNFGICVDLQGNRTRETNVEWARAPLEFVYTAPFLYVVHFESVEVFEVLPYAGLKTKALEQCNLFTLAQPHWIGMGAARGDALFVTSRLNLTEIVLFNAFNFDQKTRSLLKRKTSAVIGSLMRQNSDEKRNKW